MSRRHIKRKEYEAAILLVTKIEINNVFAFAFSSARFYFGKYRRSKKVDIIYIRQGKKYIWNPLKGFNTYGSYPFYYLLRKSLKLHFAFDKFLKPPERIAEFDAYNLVTASSLEGE